MTNVGNIYNNFFTGTFSHKEVAESFLQTYITPEIVKTMDLSTLELQDGSFASRDNKVTYTRINSYTSQLLLVA